MCHALHSRRALLTALALSLLPLTACGPDAADYSGTYAGTLESKDKEGEVLYSNTGDHLIYVAPGEGSDLVIQLRDECSATATMGKDNAFTIASQPCVYETDSYAIDGVMEGSGTVSDDGTLALDYTITGTVRRQQDSKPLESTNMFTGSRQ